MKTFAVPGLKNFIRSYSWLIRIGLLTGGAIVASQVVGFLVLYRYLKLDFYLCIVAVCFLVTGLLLNKGRPNADLVASPAKDQLTTTRPASPAKDQLTATPPTNPAKDLLTTLTSKEFLILRLLAEGKTNKEIAAANFIALSTVKTHVNNIYSKLAVSNRKEARTKYAEMALNFPIV